MLIYREEQLTNKIITVQSAEKEYLWHAQSQMVHYKSYPPPKDQNHHGREDRKTVRDKGCGEPEK